jgi:Peptidase family M49
MPKSRLINFAIIILGVTMQAQQNQSANTTKPVRNTNGNAAKFPDAAELKKMIARFAPTPLEVATSGLSEGDQKALVKLIQASRLINDIFLTQLWSGNHAELARLEKDTSELGRARLHYFWINKSPWSEIDGHTAFIPGVPPKKLPGANFYPEDMTKDEFESWAKSLPADQREQAEGFFTVIRRDSSRKLKIVSYSQEYRADLERASALLKEAAALTDNATLKKFLEARAAAFLSNDYYESDLAWMDLDAPLDITIGPYETYNDEVFGYKAGYEAYVNVRDEQESAKLASFSEHLQEIENNLPEDPQYRNPKLGASSPIRVVNQVFSAGDGNHGVQTAAYNLPNDDRVIQQKGSKRVMLKNVQEAKFRSVLQPIAAEVLPAADRQYLDFESFFTHILAHELTHGIGPHQITINGRTTNPRLELKELYSAIEEAKADITGLFALQFLMDHSSPSVPHGEEAERKLYTTFLASSFRTLRFGLKEAHARGMAIQVNYLLDKGGFKANPDGTFAVDFSKIKLAVSDLDHEFLTLEATGDYARAKKLLDTLAVVRPEVQRALDRLTHIPTDIEPIFPTANRIAPPQPNERGAEPAALRH